ncbi:MAG: VapC toxin family PIN domain ribonuclease [Acidimicrobiales bacterium]|nr:MAG: VapC toxin family PIN domain ribonuclease [Acidimicrobiales bacterium]
MIYLDTSALVKLVLTEAESSALRTWLDQRASSAKVSSEIVHVELPRAVARSNPIMLPSAMQITSGMQIVPITPRVLALAATMPPPALRSLDAIHLASALQLTEHLTAFVAYDTRLAEAAEAAGLNVVAPR